MPGRLLADVDALLMEILRAALAAFPDVTVQVEENLPDDWTDRYPIVVAHRVPGGGAVDARYLDRAIVVIEVRDDDETRARDIAEWCRTALYEAWETQFPFKHGSINRYRETAGPAVTPVMGQPDGETFVPATTELHVCP